MKMEYTAKQFIIGVLKAAVSLALLVAVFIYAEGVFRPKYTQETTTDSPVTTFVNGFYALPDNAIDVLFVGTSESFYCINPLMLWDEAQISAQVFASASQRIDISLFFITEALKTQKPAYVFFDVSRFFSPVTDMTDAKFQKTIGDIPFSLDKWDFINTRAELTGKKNTLDYVSSLVRYHDRWTSLQYPYDLSMPLRINKRDPYHGFAPLFKTTRVAMNLDRYNEEVEPTEVPASSIEHLRKMKEVCAASGAELVLIKPPTSAKWKNINSDVIAGIAAQEGLLYFDFWPIYNTEIGLNRRTDYADTTHLNYLGSEIFSRYLANFIVDTFAFEPSAQTAQTDPSQWEADLLHYRQAVKAYELTQVEDISDYLDLINDPTYTLFIAVRNDAATKLTAELDQQLRALGMEQSLLKKTRWAYIAVTSGGTLLHEELRKAPLTYSMNYKGNHVYLESVGYDDGNRIAMIINGTDYTENLIKRGIHIVVYDDVLDRIIDNICYHTNEKVLYRESES